jgi:arylsulfatase
MRASKPNIIIILADDMGFSDVGCFGSEIPTPNIDALSEDDCGGGDDDAKSQTKGMRFTQLYNCARCCPSRASILTGMYPHQAGIGHMVYDAGIKPEYQGYLRQDVPTIAELLKKTYSKASKTNDTNIANDESDGELGGGYTTYMVGKWHVGGEYPPDATHDWIQKTMGDETHPTPSQRGFDEFYGTLGGGGSYFQPPSLVRDDQVIREVMPEDFYYTDAINDEACRMIESRSKSDKEQPFFMYVAHTAPHWPLHAPKKEIEKHRGKYMKGWDELRQKRHSRLVEQNLIPPTWGCSPRDEHCPSWDEKDDKTQDWEDARMATYAAQITSMDEGIGRIVDSLRQTGLYENTVIFFLSDNGGCAEYLKENGDEGNWPEYYGGLTRDGKKIEVGNLQHLQPGGEDTFMSYDLPWANASNTPFRLFKSWVHEGGIATPFVVHWPAALSGEVDVNERMCHSPWIMMDIVATCCELGGVPIPSNIEGESFLPLLRGDSRCRRQSPIFWEHQGNCAVREGKWKLVYQRCEEGDDEWELYDMDNDRTELNNLAFQHKDRVEHMIQLWKEWAERVGVKPWPLHPIPEGEKDWSNVPWLW